MLVLEEVVLTEVEVVVHGKSKIDIDMKKWLIKSNNYYDRIKEPKRFLVFFIPIMIFIIGLNCDTQLLFGVSFRTELNIRLISLCGICLIGLWRLSPKLYK